MTEGSRAYSSAPFVAMYGLEAGFGASASIGSLCRYQVEIPAAKYGDCDQACQSVSAVKFFACASCDAASESHHHDSPLFGSTVEIIRFVIRLGYILP